MSELNRIADKAADVAKPVSVRGVVLHPEDAADVRRQKMARIVLDSMYQFLGLLDVQGTVLEINQAALDGAGLSLDDVVGKPFWQAHWWAVSEDVRMRVREMIAEARSGRFVRGDFEVFGDRHGHETIVIDFSLKPILDDAGQVAFLLPEGRNITEKIASSAELSRKNGELQAALEKLEELDNYKTQFFANISHELRTPLALILGPIDQMVKDSATFGERERFRLSVVQRNARSLLQQVNNLLDLARIDADRMPMVYAHTDVVALLRELAVGFEAVALDRQISFLARGAEEHYAEVDRAKLGRVLSNLLSNAFKFTPVGGRIVYLVEPVSPERLLISVQDNGSGVPDSMKQQIFDRFTQASAGLGTSGSGLGLNIVKEFVDLHRGTVAVLDAPGGGAVFQVELPIRAPEGAFVRVGGVKALERAEVDTVFLPELTPPVEAKFQAKKPRILVVEDNADLRLFLYEVLADDYNVTLREDGEAAFYTALANPPDLIITDLMMPRWDGERFLKALSHEPNFPKLPVLVLSARADDALRESLLEHLAKDYLTKPFSAQELRVRVRNLITVKCTVDLLQKELNSQASNILELTAGLVESYQYLQDSLAALQASERRWLGFYENTAVGIALTDHEGKIRLANPALQKMLGYGQEEILGLSLIAITEASERDTAQRNVQGLLDGSFANYTVQKRYQKKDGAYVWANVCASPIPALDQDEPRLAVVFEDISLRIEVERSLAATQNELARVARFTAMGELAASIAHEINQPLSAVITNSDAALRWLTLPSPNVDEVAAALRRAHRDANLAGAVIARIRSFLKAGQIKRERVDIRKMLDVLLQMLRTTLTEAAVKVSLHFPFYLPQIMVDQVQLQQVLLNLILNAVDAMRELPEAERLLRIRVAHESTGETVFAVQDSGLGIAPELEQQMFQALFSTKPDGLGMGLAISRSIVENHGGRLWLERNQQAGACFMLSLPTY